jgi:hypothetical protein
MTQILKKWTKPVLVLVTTLAIVLNCPNTFGQSGAGSIQGSVTDSTGAVIPGAEIRIVKQDTNATFNTKSNGIGFYQVPGLFTGTYVITVTAPSMKVYKTTIQLLVAQSAIISPVMTPGPITQQVSVTANLVQLTTPDNGSITSTLENDRINQLPNNGRLLLTLTGNTSPGLESGGDGGTVVGGMRVNGLLPEAMEYVADGAPLTNRNFGGETNASMALLPDPDAVQEVRLETTDASAQYSTPATGVITTKSGTNNLHGTFFETARNNAIGVAKARQNPSNYAAPHLVRNEFGVSAGGPIRLPRLYNGVDKSFWFFAYERYSLAQTTDELVTVPTQAMRTGDWSGLVNASNVLQTLYDPATTYNSNGAPCPGTPVTTANPNGANAYCRTAFSKNQISANRLSPTAKIIYDITPLPSNASNPLAASNLTAEDPLYEVVPTISFRLDHFFSEKNRAYLRYSSNNQTYSALRNYPLSTAATLAADGIPAEASGVQIKPLTNFATALGYTHVFSPTFFAETILSQQWFKWFTGGAGNPNLNYENMLGLPNNFGEAGFPSIGYSGGGGNLIMPYATSQYDYKENQIVSNIDENLTKVVGRHQLQFGGRYRHERFQYLPDRIADTVNFGANATALENPGSGTTYAATGNTGYADADFYLGAAASYSVSLEPPVVHSHDMEFDGYFQDNIHVSRKLTVNVGLRYEAHPAAWAKDGLVQGFDFKNDALVLPDPIQSYITKGYTTQAIVTNLTNLGAVFESPAAAGYPSTIIRSYDLTFGPRLGLAYQPFGDRVGTVIRGGYGRYIYPIPVRSSIRNSVSYVPFVASYSQSYTSASQAPDSLPNYLMRSPQSVVMGTNSSGVVNSGSTNSILPGSSVWAPSPDYAPDYVTQTNATIEQPLEGNSALRVSWVWNHGTNLDHYYEPNNAPSYFVYEMAYVVAPPSGVASTIVTNQYAATGNRPYDQTKWGNILWDTKNGWSSYNALQANYQRLFHHGIAYQISYVWSKAFRVGGNWSSDGVVNSAQNYLGVLGSAGTMTSPYGTLVSAALPPSRPAGLAPYAEWQALDRYELYTVDTAIPKQHIRFNGIVDLPFGRDKRFLGNANRFVNEIVGGFQLAGDGNIVSQDFAVSADHYGQTSPLHVYKHKAKITDCRSGVCYKSYEWFNGYLAPTVVQGGQGTCTTNCVSGLPADWAPYQTPIDNTPGTTYYGKDEVAVKLNDGTTSSLIYSPGPTGTNPFSHTVLNGPINWTVDLSVFKVFPISEKMNLRVNADAFNAFNVQGFLNPSAADGTESLRSSYNTPRQLQFTMRLTF